MNHYMRCTSQSQNYMNHDMQLNRKKDSVSQLLAQSPESSSQSNVAEQILFPFANLLLNQSMQYQRYNMNKTFSLKTVSFVAPVRSLDHLLLCQTLLDQLGHFSAPSSPPIVRISLHCDVQCLHFLIPSNCRRRAWAPADSQAEQRNWHPQVKIQLSFATSRENCEIVIIEL